MKTENVRKITALEAELSSALPLDQMRERLSYIDKTLKEKIAESMTRLNAVEISEVFAQLMKRVSAIFSGKRVTAFVNGVSEAAFNALVKQSIPSLTITAFKPLSDAAGLVSALKDPRGFIFETEDRRIRYRGTFDELVHRMLEDNRDTLLTALFGKDI